MKKKSIYILLFSLLLSILMVNQLPTTKAKASVNAEILQTYRPASKYVIVTKSVNGVTKLNFKNKNYASNYLVKFRKNQVFTNKETIKIKLPGSSEIVYVDYVVQGNFKGYITSKFTKAYNYNNDDAGESYLTLLLKKKAINEQNTTTTTKENNQDNLNKINTSTASSSNNNNSSRPSTTLEYAFEHDLVTNQQEAINTPWEKSGNNDLNEPLYNGRDIYYHINSTGNFATAWQEAIDAWNSLGVVQFIPTDSTDNDHVLMLSNANSVPNQSDDKWGGITLPNANFENGTHQSSDLTFNNCYLKTDYILQLFKNDSSDAANTAKITAEHELGHVLGFAHDPRTYGPQELRSTMNAGGDNTPQNVVGAKEQYALSIHYGLSILPNHFSYPFFNFDEESVNNSLQMSDDYPIKNKLYNYQTNNYYE